MTTRPAESPDRTHLRPVPSRTNLRRAPGTFVGRVADVEALRELFANGERLVTVTGTGGIGKTTLANRYASLKLDEYANAGGVWFCDLTEVTDRDGICARVGEVLGVPLTAGDAVTRLGHAIAARGRLLLVLDNFEQVIDHAPATMSRWLALAPDAQFLVTSRELLRLPGEVTYELAPLGLTRESGTSANSEAVQLLIDRVRRTRREFAPTAADEPLLAEIVRQLDGIPLAIELAAARMSVLGPAALLERLPRRLDLLVHGARDASSRRKTLRGAIDWSWNLLEAHQRDALAQCSVFRGGFTVEAAERVIQLASPPGGDTVVALDVLQALREKSLIGMQTARDDASELRFVLYLSIREYAAEKLEASGGSAAALARHAAHFVAYGERTAEAIDTFSGYDAIDALALERENLGAVVERALAGALGESTGNALALRALLALDPVLWVRGPYHSQLALWDDALSAAHAAEVPPILRARALLARSQLRKRRGLMSESLADVNDALAISREQGDRRLEGRAVRAVGMALREQGRLKEARASCQTALAIHCATGDRGNEGATLWGLAAIEREDGNALASNEYAERALAIHRVVGNRRAEGIVLEELGCIKLDTGDTTEARQYFAAALEIHRDTGDFWLQSTVSANLAAALHCDGLLDQAVTGYEEALVNVRQVGATRFEGLYLTYLGIACIELGRDRDAQTAFERAYGLLRDAGDDRDAAATTAYVGIGAVLRGDLDAARAAFTRAESSFEPVANDPVREGVLLLRSALDLAVAARAEAAGDKDKAHTLRTGARTRITNVQAPGPGNESHPGGTPSLAARSMDVRLALRVLERMFGNDLRAAEVAARSSANGVADALRVHARGHWFQSPGGEKVDCRKRQAARLLLLKLAEHRANAPGEPLSADALIELGWPGERIMPDAARNRLHVTLNVLRGVGLRQFLVATGEGYLLDPAVPIQLVADPV